MLVGRTPAPDDAYLQEIKRRVTQHGLTDAVTLNGAVSDDELLRWYAAADVYVSLSLHEGFGARRRGHRRRRGHHARGRDDEGEQGAARHGRDRKTGLRHRACFPLERRKSRVAVWQVHGAGAQKSGKSFVSGRPLRISLLRSCL